MYEKTSTAIEYISTIKTLEKMKVMYIEDYFPITKTFPCGYWNTPFALNYLENHYTLFEETFIHIDLDMYLMREPTEKLFHVPEDKICKIAINKYRPTDSLDYKISPIYPFEIATNFIISKSIKKYSDYCDKNKLNGLVCFWCQNLKEAKFLSRNHQDTGHKTEIINLT